MKLHITALFARIIMIIASLSVPIMMGWAAADALTGMDTLVTAVHKFVGR